MTDVTTPTTDAGRRLLDAEVEKLVLQGWRIRMERPGRTVLSRVVPQWFWLHMILTIITAGLWLAVVLVRTLVPDEERCVVWLDDEGRVLLTPAKAKDAPRA
jgi:hypothetical protein